MNRASQIALFQTTNQALLDIRQSELNYYTNLNVAFGTQAALIGGFTYGVFTQNQNNEDVSYSGVFQEIYWVTSAATIAMAVHVIITTMLLQVLGPGLALHGPVGSVANACAGMRVEQKTIAMAFIAMMVLFSITTVLSFWAVYSRRSAIAATVIFVVAARYWFYFSERIYLRFYWDPKLEQGWQLDRDRERSLSDDPAHRNEPSAGNAVHDRFHLDQDAAHSVADGMTSVAGDGLADHSEKAATGLARFLPFGRSRGRDTKPSPSELTRGLLEADHHVSVSARSIAIEGYLTKKGRDHKISDFRAEPWERLYATLNGAGNLYFYKSRQEYRDNPKRTIFKRPVVLHDYEIEVFNSQLDRRTSVDSIMTADSRAHGSSAPRFQLTLRPQGGEGGEDVRYPWVLRCDTEEELEIWSSAMRDISPDSFPH